MIKQNNMKLLIIEMVMILTLFSCVKDEFKDDELSIQRTNYTGNQLRIDGYYYEIGSDNYLYPEYFFYKNGTLIYIGGRYSRNTIDTEFIDRLKQSSYLDYAKNNKLSGGGIYN